MTKKGQEAGPSRRTFRDVASAFLDMFAGKVAAGDKSQRTADGYAYHLRKQAQHADDLRERFANSAFAAALGVS